MKLLAQHRLRIPNQLAMLAAVLLLVTSVAGYERQPTDQDPTQAVTPAASIKSSEGDRLEDNAKHRRQRLNLGFLLFRRG